MVQSSDFISNTESISYSRPMALKFLVLGAMFSWQSEGLDSVHIFDDQHGNVEMMQLEKVSYGSGWELRSFLFSFDPNSRPNFPSGYVNMNHLIDTLSRTMGKTPQEASEM
uniref:Uncharacterized protein n=1 Tax=Romanomermis culicivorax TaxID=13658 RepID=A0A915KLI0_ROMCU